jgi:ABC-type branched-subunit amino acid transport system substrate-binding protein
MSPRKSKLWRIVALLMAGSLLAAACGGDDEEETSDTTAEAGAEDDTTSTTAAEGEDGEQNTGDGKLVIGTLLPETGSLAFLGPPEFAGVDLAVEEINAAGGVLGEDVTVIDGDSGDTTTDIANQTVDRLLQQNVDAIVGAASSGVTLTVIDKIVGAGVIQFSPANTAKSLSEYDDEGLYFRTAPSDILQGQVLGELVAEDGNQTAGILALQDPYGEGLAEDFTEAYESSGGEVVETVIYDPQAQTFDAEVQQIVSADPDAIVVIGFDESARVIQTLIENGMGPGDKAIYGTDGNMGNALGEQLPAGALEGMKGTTPLSELSQDFQDKLKEIDPDLVDFNYAGESYDAVNIIALAAEIAGTDEPTKIAEEIINVTKDGEKCENFADCKQLIEDGEDIDYDGVSGPVEFDDVGDPGQASFAILQFQADNTLETLEFRIAGA